MKTKLVMIVVLMSLLIPFKVHAEDMPDINGAFGVAIDARTGEVLYDKNAREKAYPASITKIMTAMLLEENVEDGEMMEASEWAAGQEASNYHFKLTPGEKISKEDAINALMIMSANDVAVTVAEHISGSQEEFAKLMTERAKELGANDTQFRTASGLHDEGHYTTAYDIALIAKHLLDYPSIMNAMGTKTTILKTDKQNAEVTSANKILDNPLALGGKTGYTDTAQNTLMEILEKDDKLVVAVVMKTTLAEEYNDIGIMGDYAFDRMDAYQKVVEKDSLIDFELVNDLEVGFIASNDFYATIEQGEEENIHQEVVKEDLSGKNIAVGDVIGVLKISKDDQELGQVELVSDTSVNIEKTKESKKENKEAEENEGSLSFLKILIAIVGPFILYVIFVIFYNIKKRQEQKKD